MSWNFRVVRRVWPEHGAEVEYAIHEAYYGEAGEAKVEGLTVDAVDPHSDTLEGLRWCLEQMLKALDKPVLEYDDIKKGSP